MPDFNYLRVWGVYCRFSKEVVFVSPNQRSCIAYFQLIPSALRDKHEIIRFDIAECYKHKN